MKKSGIIRLGALGLTLFMVLGAAAGCGGNSSPSPSPAPAMTENAAAVTDNTAATTDTAAAATDTAAAATDTEATDKTATASLNDMKVQFNGGATQTIQTYIVNGDNYVRVREVVAPLNYSMADQSGSSVVTIDSTKPYDVSGGTTLETLTVQNPAVTLTSGAIVYNGIAYSASCFLYGDMCYFKLQDLMGAANYIQAPNGINIAENPSTNITSINGGVSKTPEVVKMADTDNYDLEVMMITYSAGWAADSPYIKELNQKLNINLTFDLVPYDSYLEKLNVMAASNSFPDSYILSEAQFTQWVGKGIFSDLKPMLDTGNYPNLTNYLDQDAFQLLCPPGKYYGLPYYLPASRDSLYIRQDWLDKLGLPVPQTLDDFLNVCNAFANDDPDEDGKADTTGFTAYLRQGLPVSDSLFYIAGAFGVPNCWKLDPTTNQLVPWETCTTEMEAFLTYMNKMYQGGGLDKDIAVNNLQNTIDKFSSGKAGVYDGNPNNNSPTGIILAPLLKVDPNAVMVPILPPAGLTGIRATKTFASNQKTVINSSISSGKQTRLMEFYNYLIGDEGLRMMKNGLEGIDYTQNADGTYTQLPSFTTDFSNMLFAWLIRRFDPIYFTAPAFWRDQTYANEASAAISAAAPYVVPNPAEGLVSDTNVKLGTNLDNNLTSTIASIITGDMPVSAWDQAVQDWRSGGGDQIIKEMNDAYAALNAQ